MLPYLERAALTPHVRDLAPSHEVGLKDLRVAAAEATGQEVPEIVPIRRVRPRDFVLTAFVAVAAYLMITKLAKIGFGTISGELRTSDLTWVAVGLILAQLTFVARARVSGARCPTPLPFGPCVALQSAIKFINMTVPSSAGASRSAPGSCSGWERRPGGGRRGRGRRASDTLVQVRCSWSPCPSSTST